MGYPHLDYGVISHLLCLGCASKWGYTWISADVLLFPNEKRTTWGVWKYGEVCRSLSRSKDINILGVTYGYIYIYTVNECKWIQLDQVDSFQQRLVHQPNWEGISMLCLGMQWSSLKLGLDSKNGWILSTQNLVFHPCLDCEKPTERAFWGSNASICLNHIKVRFYKLVPLRCKFVYNFHPTINISAIPSELNEHNQLNQWEKSALQVMVNYIPKL